MLIYCTLAAKWLRLRLCISGLPLMVLLLGRGELGTKSWFNFINKSQKKFYIYSIYLFTQSKVTQLPKYILCPKSFDKKFPWENAFLRPMTLRLLTHQWGKKSQGEVKSLAIFTHKTKQNKNWRNKIQFA